MKNIFTSNYTICLVLLLISFTSKAQWQDQQFTPFKFTIDYKAERAMGNQVKQEAQEVADLQTDMSADDQLQLSNLQI